jgi:hypothetical protein
MRQEPVSEMLQPVAVKVTRRLPFYEVIHLDE